MAAGAAPSSAKDPAEAFALVSNLLASVSRDGLQEKDSKLLEEFSSAAKRLAVKPDVPPTEGQVAAKISQTAGALRKLEQKQEVHARKIKGMEEQLQKAKEEAAAMQKQHEQLSSERDAAKALFQKPKGSAAPDDDAATEDGGEPFAKRSRKQGLTEETAQAIQTKVDEVKKNVMQRIHEALASRTPASAPSAGAEDVDMHATFGEPVVDLTNAALVKEITEQFDAISAAAAASLPRS